MHNVKQERSNDLYCQLQQHHSVALGAGLVGMVANKISTLQLQDCDTMKPETDTILGYAQLPDGGWEPILPAEPGYIYTQAFILCQQCQTAIRPQGGPSYNSLCPTCYEQNT
jgi:hypothetical protein